MVWIPPYTLTTAHIQSDPGSRNLCFLHDSISQASVLGKLGGFTLPSDLKVKNLLSLSHAPQLGQVTPKSLEPSEI